MITRLLAGLSIITSLAGLLAPAVGPLMDHHFAERQPAHQHLGLVPDHIHDYGANHAHRHAGPDGAGGGNGTALYNAEGGPAGSIVAFTTDKAMQAFLLFEPTSTVSLPASLDRLARQAFTPPPDRPPRLQL
jgi:hypothetical protein